LEIKYFLLQFSPKQDIHFDPKASLSFEGNTGPYCQYTYARAKSILAKSAIELKIEDADFSALVEIEERALARKLIDFSDQIIKAASELNPSRIVTLTYELTKSFNQFYQKHSVLNNEDQNLKKGRLLLTKAAAIAIKKGLALLNIQVLEQM
jgi:arginyl-tRNA synthetase